jgi:hypothetical protein
MPFLRSKESRKRLPYLVFLVILLAMAEGLGHKGGGAVAGRCGAFSRRRGLSKDSRR